MTDTRTVVAECYTCVGCKPDADGRFTIPFPLELSRVAADTHKGLNHDVRKVKP